MMNFIWCFLGLVAMVMGRSTFSENDQFMFPTEMKNHAMKPNSDFTAKDNMIDWEALKQVIPSGVRRDETDKVTDKNVREMTNMNKESALNGFNKAAEEVKRLPRYCPLLYLPVCASYEDFGTTLYQTFSNKCFLEAENSQSNNKYTFVHDGECEK